MPDDTTFSVPRWFVAFQWGLPPLTFICGLLAVLGLPPFGSAPVLTTAFMWGIAAWFVWNAARTARAVRVTESGLDLRLMLGPSRSFAWDDIDTLSFRAAGHAGQYGAWPASIVISPKGARSIRLEGFINRFGALYETLRVATRGSVRWE